MHCLFTLAFSNVGAARAIMSCHVMLFSTYVLVMSFCFHLLGRYLFFQFSHHTTQVSFCSSKKFVILFLTGLCDHKRCVAVVSHKRPALANTCFIILLKAIFLIYAHGTHNAYIHCTYVVVRSSSK